MILRKLSQRRNWDKEKWLGSDEVQGNALHCLLPKCNRLSIFKIDQKLQRERTVAALALTRDNLSYLDLAEFNEELISSLDIRTEEVLANTPDYEVNGWHIDLVELTVSKIARIAISIRNEGKVMRYPQGDVIKFISNSIRDKCINLEEINPQMQSSLRKRNVL